MRSLRAVRASLRRLARGVGDLLDTPADHRRRVAHFVDTCLARLASSALRHRRADYVMLRRRSHP